MEGSFSDHLFQTLKLCKDVDYETMLPELIRHAQCLFVLEYERLVLYETRDKVIHTVG